MSLGAAISVINWAEVMIVTVRRGNSIEQLQQGLRTSGVLGQEGLLTIADLTPDDAQSAAELYTRTKSAGLSLADRLCLATAMRMRLPVLTSDRAWLGLDLASADIRFIHPAA